MMDPWGLAFEENQSCNCPYEKKKIPSNRNLRVQTPPKKVTHGHFSRSKVGASNPFICKNALKYREHFSASSLGVRIKGKWEGHTSY